MTDLSLEKLTLEKEELCLKGRKLYIYRPAKLEEVFEGDPFLEVQRFPFWVKIWPASLALAEYLARLEAPKEILEVGSGLGIPSLFACAFGHKVLATDKEELPLKILQRVAQEQGLSLHTLVLDWINPDLEGKFEIIAGAEIVIKATSYEPLLSLFKRFLTPEGHIILAHEADRKRTLIPFLVKAEAQFSVETSIWRLKEREIATEIILNRLRPR